MAKYEIAVFDLDGTLLDTTEGVLSAVRHTIQKNNLKELVAEELVQFIGPPIQDSFARAFGLEGPILQELATDFRNQYKDVDLLKAEPYDGIYELMDELRARDIKVAVATYKREDYALTILKHFGFDRYSDIMYGADHENKLKKVDIIEKCMKDLGCTDYSKAVMIGDSCHDAIGAEKIGMDFLGVTYGFDFKTEQDVMRYPNVGYATKAMDLLKYFE